ncbi:hypothetical protein EHM92_04220 [bacterium]|nr:MAG: hypothetical protein EHM92_04220 [bacterium]
MKPVVPKVPLKVWRNLYRAADAFRRARPWEWFDDVDLVGVRHPQSGQTGFGVCMGSAGTLFGLCLYRGAEGLNFYRSLIEEEVEEEHIFAMQNCLKLELGERNSLPEEDRAIIRRLGLTFKGKHAWPEFRSLLPGYAPWFLNREEAEFLTLGLDAVCHHLQLVLQSDVIESVDGIACLVYTPRKGTGGEFDASWEDWPGSRAEPVAPAILNVARIDAIRAKNPEHDGVWEADVFHQFTMILDRDRPYWVRAGVVCDHITGFVIELAVVHPEVPLGQVLVDTICSALEKASVRPKQVYVKGDEQAAALAPLAKLLGFPVGIRRDLPAVVELQEAMEQDFGGRRRRGDKSIN